MSNILSLTWNKGIAVGEFISAALISFLVLTITLVSKRKNNLNKLSLAGLYSLSALFSFFLGKAIGNLVTSNGNVTGDKGLGLMVPLFAILISFDQNAFDALPMILGFQLLGTILGLLIYIIIANAYKKNNPNESISISDGILVVEGNRSSIIQIEIIGQLLLGGLFISIPFIGGEVLGANIYTNMFVVTGSLFVVFAIFGNLSNLMLSPFISLGSLILGYILKTHKKEYLINFIIQLTIYAVLAASIGGIDNIIRY